MSEPAADESHQQRRALLTLSLGAALGLALGAYGLVGGGSGTGALPDGVVASVNGDFIDRDGYERLVAGLDADTREPITPELRKRVLDRMIDEELLVQRGLELGLAESDRRVRADITSAMIRSVVLEAEDTPPTEDELVAFHESDAAFFTQPGRVRVGQVFFRVPSPGADEEVKQRAERARDRLRNGDDLETVRSEDGDREVSTIPNAMLPPAKLREYVGPTALRAVMTMAESEISDPVRSGTGYHVFVLAERERERVPPFEEIREQVRAEWVRRSGDTALRAYLDGLRRDADVIVRDGLQ
jgi:parvulin-like peptidyl-prolyl isomerase